MLGNIKTNDKRKICMIGKEGILKSEFIDVGCQFIITSSMTGIFHLERVKNITRTVLNFTH